ncbi:hypothetical protein EW146_g8101, partial [Bondarzewia mesenterica]
PPPSGVRTISAAAFRRPQNRVPSTSSDALPLVDTSPLSLKKRGLPSSPYATRTGAHSSSASLGQPLPQQSQQSGPSPPAVGEEEHFDYISAYVDGEEDRQQHKDGGGRGFAGGRYATNLEESELR